MGRNLGAGGELKLEWVLGLGGVMGWIDGQRDVEREGPRVREGEGGRGGVSSVDGAKGVGGKQHTWVWRCGRTAGG